MADEQSKEKVATMAKWGLGLVGAIIISPIIFLAVKGIVGLALALGTGFAVIQFAPVVAQKIANRKVKMILSESRKNPVEDEINAAKLRESRLAASKASITKFQTEVTNYESKVVKFSKEFPDEANKFQGQLDKMKRLLLYRVEKWKEAKREHEKSLVTIEKMRALWEMSQEAQRMNKLAGLQEEDIMEKIKAEVRMESVENSINTAFSELDSALMDDEAKRIPDDYKPSIEYKPAEIVEFTEEPVEAEVVPIQRRRATR